MNRKEALLAWGRVLKGKVPSLSIEITRECPLRCPGCYAYEEAHLGGLVTLRELTDHQGNQLVDGVLELVDRYKPLHLSLVGGDPLVRFRELNILLPKLNTRGIYVQVVTSAFRPIPVSWAALENIKIAVSVDGLPPEHDVRRKPATYERILRNIAGHKVIVHCTLTRQMMQRPDYLGEFVQFWSAREETRKIWVSMFTPQRGADLPECLSAEQRRRAIDELLRLREIYPKLKMGRRVIEQFRDPPQSPEDCLFAQTTLTLSSDLQTRIAPCQFGGDPDCSRCGCLASMGLAAVERHNLLVGITVGHVFRASSRIGRMVSKLAPRSPSSPPRRHAPPSRQSSPA